MCGCFVAPEGPLGFARSISSGRATLYKLLQMNNYSLN
jgi:hypothetical protein